MEQEKKYGAAECGDCNTCPRNCNGQNDNEIDPAQEALDAAVLAAAAVDRNSYEKNSPRMLL